MKSTRRRGSRQAAWACKYRVSSCIVVFRPARSFVRRYGGRDRRDNTVRAVWTIPVASVSPARLPSTRHVKPGALYPQNYRQCVIAIHIHLIDRELRHQLAMSISTSTSNRYKDDIMVVNYGLQQQPYVSIYGPILVYLTSSLLPFPLFASIPAISHQLCFTTPRNPSSGAKA